jgi:hypothetical protein
MSLTTNGATKYRLHIIHKVRHQLVNPNDHKVTAAERTTHTWKNYLIAGMDTLTATVQCNASTNLPHSEKTQIFYES